MNVELGQKEENANKQTRHASFTQSPSLSTPPLDRLP
jgi:hypothetical protein